MEDTGSCCRDLEAALQAALDPACVAKGKACRSKVSRCRTKVRCTVPYPADRKTVSSSRYTSASSRKCFSERGSLLRGSAHAESRRRMAGRPASSEQPPSNLRATSSEGRAIQRPFTHHPLLLLLLLFPNHPSYTRYPPLLLPPITGPSP